MEGNQEGNLRRDSEQKIRSDKRRRLRGETVGGVLQEQELHIFQCSSRSQSAVSRPQRVPPLFGLVLFAE